MIDFRKKRYLSVGQVTVSNAAAGDVPATAAPGRDGIDVVIYDTTNPVFFDPIDTATAADFPIKAGGSYDFQCSAKQTLSAIAGTAPVQVGYMEYRYV